MSTAEGEPELYLDADGVPILFDVVVAGDMLRASGFQLQHRERDEAAAASALERAAPGAGQDLPAEERSDLERRIREAVQAALPRAAEQAMINLRRSMLGRSGPDKPPETD